ncbi:MAG TPA: Arm DNA-binding domain-containing protein [Candidatus Binataceae bacterium]|nr:Arm DNA-binding domain-containing protein [Candidatus Binataceae bacterium]
MHLDGAGRYLRVQQSKSSGCSVAWIYRYQNRGMGLGALNLVSLAQAREKAAQARQQRWH